MKNDLSQFMKHKKPILSETPSGGPERQAPRLKAVPKPVPKPVIRKRKKDKAECRVQAMLTKSEYDNLLSRAGDVPVSKYLRLALRRAGEI